MQLNVHTPGSSFDLELSSTPRRRSFGLKAANEGTQRISDLRGPGIERRNVRLTIDPVRPAGHLPPPGIYLEL